METRPLFSKELEKLRGALSASAIANSCHVSRQYIRQVEKGKRAPSNEVLKKWLASFNLTLSERPDIARSVNTYREQVNTYVNEYAELEKESTVKEVDLQEEFLKEVRHLISEGGYLNEDFVENRIYLIRKSYERHHK